MTLRSCGSVKCQWWKPELAEYYEDVLENIHTHISPESSLQVTACSSRGEAVCTIYSSHPGCVVEPPLSQSSPLGQSTVVYSSTATDALQQAQGLLCSTVRDAVTEPPA